MNLIRPKCKIPRSIPLLIMTIAIVLSFSACSKQSSQDTRLERELDDFYWSTRCVTPLTEPPVNTVLTSASCLRMQEALSGRIIAAMNANEVVANMMVFVAPVSHHAVSIVVLSRDPLDSKTRRFLNELSSHAQKLYEKELGITLNLE
jgi:hypothetical protein